MLQTVAPRSATRFRCIADKCEDTCCEGLTVPVEEERFVQLEALLRKRGVVTDKGTIIARPGPGTEYGRLVPTASGRCFFLTANKMCELHMQHEFDAMPEFCHMFPRRYIDVGGRRELTLTLACPEAARLCLLVGDASELTLFEDPALSTLKAMEIDPADDDSYVAHFDTLRGVCLETMRCEAIDLRARLFSILFFASQLDAWLVRGSPPIDDSRLPELVRAFSQASTFAQAQAKVQNLPPDESSLALQHMVPLLLARLGPNARNLQTKLLDSVWRVYTGSGLPFHDPSCEAGDNRSLQGGFSFNARALWETYREKRALWAPFAPRIDGYMRNFINNSLLSETYTREASLFTYLAKLAVRYGLIRFLFFGHPELQGIESQIAHGDDARPAIAHVLDKAIVETVYLFTRYFSQGELFINDLDTMVSKSVTNVTAVLPFAMM